MNRPGPNDHQGLAEWYLASAKRHRDQAVYEYDNDQINETKMELLFADNLTATAQVYATLANGDMLAGLVDRDHF